MQFFKETKIDFIGYRKIAMIISAIIILIGLVSLIIKGGPRYGIDFTGGTSLQIRFEKPMDIGTLRSVLSTVGLGNSEIKEFAATNEFLIRIQLKAGGEDPSDRIIQEISNQLKDDKFEIRSKETVGPRIGSELRRAAIWAILLAALLILIYVGVRFEFKYASGAVIALFHDVLIPLTFFSLLNREITLNIIAAFLTIVGYSINDTIVIFDRIRENLKIYRREDYLTIINLSINQTLGRTILTSLTVFFVVVILFFFGGEVIHDFSLALLIGLISGTYSTVYIATATAVEWYLAQERKKRKAALAYH
jgi:preprotein translocase SecF subunit